MTAKKPKGYATINPFIVCKDAKKAIEFVINVFEGEEQLQARTVDNDGLLLHSEIIVGDTTIAIADRKPTWTYMPSLLQVWVDDLDGTLERAKQMGGEIVTKPTPFFGDVFARILDPFGNLWWLYKHNPDATNEWVGEEAESAEWSADDGADETWGSTPEMDYIYNTLTETLDKIAKNN